MEKATGWKIPLIFCGIVVCSVACLKFIMPSEVNESDIPVELFDKARAIKIDLDTGDSKVWKDRIIDASAGFISGEVKDQKLKEIVDAALQQNRFDVACTASVLIKASNMKVAVLNDVFAKAIINCEDLPWCVFAVHGMADKYNKNIMSERLTKKWLKCQP